MRRMNKMERRGWLGVALIWGTLALGIVLAVRGHGEAGLLVLLLSVLFALCRPHSRRTSTDGGEGAGRAASDTDAWRGRFAGDVKALVARRQEEGEGGFA